MLEILTVQVIAATLGTISIGGADWLYHHGRVRRPLHALWVSSSSTAICLPLLSWTINVFLGVGVFSWGLVTAFAAVMFLWMYRNLLQVPSVQMSGSGQAALGTRRPVPPSSTSTAD